jgi:hypothetical protein
MIAGKRDQLTGKIQESYGISKDEAEKQLATWQERQKEKEMERSRYFLFNHKYHKAGI